MHFAFIGIGTYLTGGIYENGLRFTHLGGVRTNLGKMTLLDFTKSYQF